MPERRLTSYRSLGVTSRKPWHPRSRVSSYFKGVRFGENFLDTSQFMQNLWRIKALKFQCVYA